MIRSLFAPKTPNEEWAEERAKVAKRSAHLALVPASADPRPNPEMFVWKRLEDLYPVMGREG